jgi:hypothetical protein
MKGERIGLGRSSSPATRSPFSNVATATTMMMVMMMTTDGYPPVTRRLLALCAALALWPGVVSAQEEAGADQTVQDILGFLVTNRGVDTSDFDRDREAAEATRGTLSRALLSAVATLPVGSSSSGFSYRLNPSLGTVERASETFGPFFVERALTAGAGQASLGITFHYASFRSLDGNDLRDGGFVTVANQFTDEPEPFDVETLTLDITTRTVTFFGNVGVSDRVDIGVAVPLLQLSVDGTRLNTYRGNTALQARATAETLGLADIALRSKVRLTGDGPVAVAGGVEVRVPTGREEDMLGAGDASLRLLGLASYEAGPASFHLNVIVGAGGVGTEVSSSGAATLAASPRLTLVGEIVARRILGIERIIPAFVPHPRILGVQTIRLVPGGEDQTTMFAVAGFKWNVGGTWLLHGNVLVPVSDNGLTARLTPTVALDYSFAR